METSLTYKPRISVSYKRHNTDLMISGNLGFLLSSKYPLKEVKDYNATQSTQKQQLDKPDVISPVFNLNKAKTGQKLDIGFFDGAPFPFPHTLVIVSTKQKWTTSDLVAQGKEFGLFTTCSCFIGFVFEQWGTFVGEGKRLERVS